MVVITMGFATSMPLAASDVKDGKETFPPKSGDILERARHGYVATQRIEQLDQDAWKAISKDADIELAILSMSEAADLARNEFGQNNWQSVLKGSLVTGLRSVNDLPKSSKQSYLDARKANTAATYLWSQGSRESAITRMREAQESTSQILGKKHILTAHSLIGLAFHECAFEDFSSAKAHMVDAVDVLKFAWGEQNPGYANALYYQAVAEAGLAELEPAERHLRQVIKILEPLATDGFNGFYLMMHAESQIYLARLQNDQGRFNEAEIFARRGSETMAFAPERGFGKYLEGQLEVARSVSGLERRAEAEMIFNSLLRSLPANSPPEFVASILNRYAEHFRRNDREADAEVVEAHARRFVSNQSRKQVIGSRRLN